MTKKIALIGCGNIGSRHLQALVKLPFSTEISIVEPNKSAQRIGVERLNQIKINKKKQNIFWYSSINELKNKFDVVIIATTAKDRVKMINRLLKMGNTRFLIEKIVCQSLSEYNILLKNIKKNHAKGWVNTNMPYFKAYQNIKKYFKNSKRIHISLTTAGHYGLGTNAIHYLDFFCWFTNDYKITLDGKFLFNRLFPNKRDEKLVEFAGILSGINKDGSTITLNFIPNADLPLILNIYGDNNKHLIIDEVAQKTWNILDKKFNFSYTYEHTSTLTTKIISDIIKKDDCKLTSIENSFYIHKELFRVFNDHIKKITHERKKICPIT
jgi:hypothetical protein